MEMYILKKGCETMKINSIRSVISFLILAILIVGNASAATVEVIAPEKLPVQLQEGEQVDFTIKIKDYDDARQLTIETNLVSSTDKPLWNFGDSEPIIEANKYQQKITLNLSSLPAILTVSVSGKVPEGIDRVKCGDIVLNRIHGTSLKFYEVRVDEKLVKIDSFGLIIKIKEDFDKTLQQIRRKELDGMKTEVTKVFDAGLTTDAQNIVTEMNNIKWPDSLMLFGIIKIENDMMINGIIIGSILITFVVGYILGSRGSEDDDDSDA